MHMSTAEFQHFMLPDNPAASKCDVSFSDVYCTTHHMMLSAEPQLCDTQVARVCVMVTDASNHSWLMSLVCALEVSSLPLRAVLMLLLGFVDLHGNMTESYMTVMSQGRYDLIWIFHADKHREMLFLMMAHTHAHTGSVCLMPHF